MPFTDNGSFRAYLELIAEALNIRKNEALFDSLSYITSLNIIRVRTKCGFTCQHKLRKVVSTATLEASIISLLEKTERNAAKLKVMSQRANLNTNIIYIYLYKSIYICTDICFVIFIPSICHAGFSY